MKKLLLIPTLALVLGTGFWGGHQVEAKRQRAGPTCHQFLAVEYTPGSFFYFPNGPVVTCPANVPLTQP